MGKFADATKNLKSVPNGAAKATLGGTSRDLVPSNVQVLRNLAAGVGA